jgi:prefoldin alpha subunit
LGSNNLNDFLVDTGKTILVPLTNSLYVPGKLSDPEYVIVDVGTGYFVKKVSVIFYYMLYSTLSLLILVLC